MSNISNRGFTIIELLIVIVVIAILAAISIVSYNGIQERARATVVQSDLSNAAKKIELARIDATDGLYPTALTTAMDIRVTKSAYNTTRNNWYYCTSADRTRFAIGGVVQGGGNKGYIYSSNSTISTSNDLWSGQVCGAVGKPDGGGVWVGVDGVTGKWNAALQG